MLRNLARSGIAIAAIGLAAVACVATEAEAQAIRTFVSGTGADTGTCGRAAPCRSLAYALSQTASAGEVVVLDSAGYGQMTITQAVTISNPGGVEAGITATSGQPAITVNTFGAATTVVLRGLTVDGQGVGSDGILFLGTGRLEIVDCTIHRFTHDGINTPIGQFGGTNPNTIFIGNTTASDNGSSGIEIAPTNPFLARGAIDHVVTNGNGQAGILVNGSVTGTGAFVDLAISSALADSNGTDGFTIEGNGNVKVDLKNSSASNNAGNGLTVSHAIVGLTGTSLVQNAAGFAISNSGTIDSYSDNVIGDNRNANTGALTPASKQ